MKTITDLHLVPRKTIIPEKEKVKTHKNYTDLQPKPLSTKPLREERFRGEKGPEGAHSTAGRKAGFDTNETHFDDLT